MEVWARCTSIRRGAPGAPGGTRLLCSLHMTGASRSVHDVPGASLAALQDIILTVGSSLDLPTVQKRLDDPNLYTRDRNAFTEASEALASVQAKLAEAEERWLELEILREELDSQ